jgi:hypothetical protein
MVSNQDPPYSQRAVDNLERSLDLRARLPANVFRDGWSEFLFFDPSVLFHRDLVSVFAALRKAESSTCCCLKRVANTGMQTRSSEIFSIDATTTFEAYWSRIQDRDPTERALVRLDRFAAISVASKRRDSSASLAKF